MAIIPYIKVNEIKAVTPPDYTHRNKVCVIGNFDKTKSPATVSSGDYTFIINTVKPSEVADKLGTDTTTYTDLKVIPQIFKGATSLVTVNLATSSGVTTVTADVIGQALNALVLEDFDIVFICAEQTDTLLAPVKAFDNKRLETKQPVDFVLCGTRSSAADYTTSAALMPRSCNFLTQTFDTLSLLESAALLCGFICNNTLDTSLTNKIIDEVDSLGTEYTFGTTELGYKLVELGYTVFKITNRLDSKVRCVNGLQFNGLDGYHNRVTSAIIDEFRLIEYLGERNNTTTLTNIMGECARIKDLYVSQLGYAKDIDYFVEKSSADRVTVNLNKIVYDGVITEIFVNFTVEVE